MSTKPTCRQCSRVACQACVRFQLWIGSVECQSDPNVPEPSPELAADIAAVGELIVAAYGASTPAEFQVLCDRLVYLRTVALEREQKVAP